MRQTTPNTRWLSRPNARTICLIATLSFLICAFQTSQAQVPQPPITSSGLNTQVNPSLNHPLGEVQYDITGGTRAGTNLFHSFGQFNVPTNNIANFLNDFHRGIGHVVKCLG